MPLIDQFPGQRQLSDVLALSPDILPVGGLLKIKDQVLSLAPRFDPMEFGNLGGIGSLDVGRLPSLLTKDGLAEILDRLLGKLRSFDAVSLLGDVAEGRLPVSLHSLKEFGIGNLNGTIGQITALFIPSPSFQPPSIQVDVLGIDMAVLAEAMGKLGRTGAETPARLLMMLLRLAENAVTTITDIDLLTAKIVQSVREIYTQEIENLQYRLPLYAVERAVQLFSADQGGTFLESYALLLDEIDALDRTNTNRLARILSTGGNIAAELRRLAQTRQTLHSLAAGDITALTVSLENVADPAASSEVFLQKYFDSFEQAVVGVLGKLGGPVGKLGDMAGGIEDFLNRTADLAEETAGQVADLIQTNLARADEFLGDIEATINDVATQIADFVGMVKAKAKEVAGYAKLAVAKVGTAVESFFDEVERLKLQLDSKVKEFQVLAEEKLDETFETIERKIRELLDLITSVLDRAEVKDALAVARQGIEKFTVTIDEASLEPIFDLVIGQAGEVEKAIKSLNVAQMSMPQKVALKAGAKLIGSVNVDDIVKPELISIFRQIQEPLLQIVRLLKDKAVEIERHIDQFNPGSVIADLISGPYRSIVDVLDQVRPSRLLAPLRATNDKLTEILLHLDPRKLIDEAQALYGKLAGLLDVLDPAPLSAWIGQYIDLAVSQLTRLRDRGMESMLKTVRETISLQNLLRDSGIEEIAQAEFWDLLRNILGGGYLDRILEALDGAVERLAERSPVLDFNETLDLLNAVGNAIERQTKATAPLLNARVLELQSTLAATDDALQELEKRRAGLIGSIRGFPEIGRLLADLSLAPVLELAAWTPPAATSGSLAAIAEVLAGSADVVREIGYADLRSLALKIYRRQIGEPVGQLIEQIRIALEPFGTLVHKVQRILLTIAAIPAKIDADVGLVLDTARDSIKLTIGKTIDVLQTFQGALTGVLTGVFTSVKEIVGDFSPAWLLNSFTVSDFTEGFSATVPGGLVGMAEHIRSGIGIDAFGIPVLLQSKLSQDQLALLEHDLSENTLRPGSRDNVIFALNKALRDRALTSHADMLKAGLAAHCEELSGKRGRTAEESKDLYRCEALIRELRDATADYLSGFDKESALIRLNRVILEAAYRRDIVMSLPSLYLFSIANIARLYPEETVFTLDEIHATVKNHLMSAPDRFIREPLDGKFRQIKAILRENFDISGIFSVLEMKLDGLDEDLSVGLDRLSLTYRNLLATLDTRLAGAY